MARPGRNRKTEALREHGALHAHPERVRDPLFDSNDFFDPQDLIQVKYEMVRRVHSDGASVAGAAQAFGLSRPTFYEAQRALEADGLAGLLPKRRGPRAAHKLTPEIMAAVVEQREREAQSSSAQLAAFVQERFGRSVHPRSIERALARREKKRRERR
jgi:transposase